MDQPAVNGARSPEPGSEQTVAGALEGDRALLTRFRDGDRSALAQVYRYYVADVVRLARFGFVVPGPPPARVPGLSPEEQLDVAHEVFLRAFAPSARIAYDGLRPYRAWLLRIAKNLRIDQCRRGGRELLVLDERDDGGFGDIDRLLEADRALVAPGGTGGPDAIEESLDWSRRAEATRQFVAGQDEPTRRFVELRFVRELSRLEIGRQLGLSRQRIRTLEARLQRDLQTFLDKRGLSANSPTNAAASNVGRGERDP